MGLGSHIVVLIGVIGRSTNTPKNEPEEKTNSIVNVNENENAPLPNEELKNRFFELIRIEHEKRKEKWIKQSREEEKRIEEIINSWKEKEKETKINEFLWKNVEYKKIKFLIFLSQKMKLFCNKIVRKNYISNDVKKMLKIEKIKKLY